MAYRLAPHVHIARVDDDLVILDAAAGDYLCVPGGVTALAPGEDLRSLQPRDPEVAAELVAAGWFRDASRGAPVMQPPEPLPGRSVAAGPDTPTLIDRLRLVAACSDLLTGYVGRPFNVVLERASAGARRRACSGANSPLEVERLARVFQRLAIWLPLPGKCLVRSFVLLRFLQRSGLGADWVFGVRVWPFGAHCWLQADGVALDDAAERLHGFTPILRVGG